MAHYHYCETCKVQVSFCADDACKADPDHANAGKHYCSVHHPDPAYHIEPTPPLKRK